MVERSKAAHHPSSNLAMTIPPQSSKSMYRSGTPVSVISMTSNRQQFALQFEHVTSSVGKLIMSIVIAYHSSSITRSARYITLCEREGQEKSSYQLDYCAVKLLRQLSKVLQWHELRDVSTYDDVSVRMSDFLIALDYAGLEVVFD